MNGLLSLYVMATALTAFAGFRDAAGRNCLIHKSRYYMRCIVRAVGLGQTMLGALATLGMAILQSRDLTLLEQVAWSVAPIYFAYTATVLVTFLPYALRSPDVRALVTVAVFGPLTLLQPVVVCVGLYVALATRPPWPVAVFFALGSLFAWTFESVLSRTGWASKEASLSRPETRSRHVRDLRDDES